jgi:hypothetical protein
MKSSAQPEIIALVVAPDAYQDTLYSAVARHVLDLASLSSSQVLFAVAAPLSLKSSMQLTVTCFAGD